MRKTSKAKAEREDEKIREYFLNLSKKTRSGFVTLAPERMRDLRQRFGIKEKC